MLITASLALVAVVLLIGLKFWEQKDIYYIAFENVSVSGISVGSQVQLKGVNIGVIEDIALDVKNVERIVVRLSIRHGTPIPQDTEAIVQARGLTGLKFIELSKGSKGASLLKPGAYIRMGDSFLDELSGRATDISEKVEVVVNNAMELTGRRNREKVERILNNLDRALETINTALPKEIKRIDRILNNAEQVTMEAHAVVATANATVASYQGLLTKQEVSAVVQDVQTSLGVVRKSLDDLKLDALIARVEKDVSAMDLPGAAKSFRSFVDRSNTAVDNFDLMLLRSREDVYESLDFMRDGMQNFREFTRIVNENPSLLFSSPTKAERTR